MDTFRVTDTLSYQTTCVHAPPTINEITKVFDHVRGEELSSGLKGGRTANKILGMLTDPDPTLHLKIKTVPNGMGRRPCFASTSVCQVGTEIHAPGSVRSSVKWDVSVGVRLRERGDCTESTLDRETIGRFLTM